jgi:hypothetical protein
MAASVRAAIAAVQQITTGEDHKAPVVIIKIEAFDERFWFAGLVILIAAL